MRPSGSSSGTASDTSASPLVRAMTLDELHQASSAAKVRMVYGDGGAFLDTYRMHRRIPAPIERSDQILVLPSTYAVSRLKLGFRRSDILFRRDENRSKEFAPRSLFCHDMALGLGRIATSVEGSGTG